MKFHTGFIVAIFLFCFIAACSSKASARSFEGFEWCVFPASVNGASDRKGTPVKDSSAQLKTNIQDSLTHKSLKQVLAGVKNLKEGKIGEIIQRFSGADTNWVWKVKEGVLPRYSNASTERTSDGVLTTLNYNKLKGATNLSVARTLIHELVHAYLVLYFRYDKQASEAYPRIVAAYCSVPEPDLNDIHHREMAASFVHEIALALREYGCSLGLSVKDSVYLDLAWGGLDFRNNDELEEESKVRILRRLNAEQFGSPTFSTYPVGHQMGD